MEPGWRENDLRTGSFTSDLFCKASIMEVVVGS